MNTDVAGLGQLRELALPEAVPYWPATWGWGVAAGLLTVALAWFAVRYWRHRQSNRYRRQALAELDRLAKDVQGNPLAARGLPGLLKRTALAAHGKLRRDRIAALRGDAWLAYLVQSAARAPFPPDSAHLLATLSYAPDAAVRSLDTDALGTLMIASRQWMKTHVAS